MKTPIQPYRRPKELQQLESIINAMLIVSCNFLSSTEARGQLLGKEFSPRYVCEVAIYYLMYEL